jgi:hypothetical protein
MCDQLETKCKQEAQHKHECIYIAQTMMGPVECALESNQIYLYSPSYIS